MTEQKTTTTGMLLHVAVVSCKNSHSNYNKIMPRKKPEKAVGKSLTQGSMGSYIMSGIR